MNKGRTIVVDNIVYPKVVEEAVIDRKTGKSLYEKLKNVDNEIRQGSSTERPVLEELLIEYMILKLSYGLVITLQNIQDNVKLKTICHMKKNKNY